MTLPRAVVFDLDGTLFDHAASARRGLVEWVGGMGLRLTDEVAAAWTAAEQRHFAAWRSGEVSWAEQRRRRLRDVLPLLGAPVGAEAELDAVFAGFLSAYERAWVGFADAATCLDGVHALGTTTAVLTNGTEEQQRAKLARTGLLERVGPVFTAEGLGVAKPDAGAFLRACELLALAPDQVLHVGDDLVVDVLAARAAGLRAVHLDRTGAGPLDDPARITTLVDLPRLLRSSTT